MMIASFLVKAKKSYYLLLKHVWFLLQERYTISDRSEWANMVCTFLETGDRSKVELVGHRMSNCNRVESPENDASSCILTTYENEALIPSGNSYNSSKYF